MQSFMVLGRKTGYLASRILETISGAYLVPVDITKKDDVRTAIRAVSRTGTIVINAAGFTGKNTAGNIDGCEIDDRAREQTMAVNAIGAVHVADACTDFSVRLVHIGSGCIYDGGNHDESALPSPVSWYGWTKSWGDAYVALQPDALVLRIRLPIDDRPHPRNLLTKLLGFKKVVSGVLNSLTSVPELLKALPRLAVSNLLGTVNYVNDGSITHDEILQIWERVTGRKVTCTWVSLDEADRTLYKVRRTNTILVNSSHVHRAMKTVGGSGLSPSSMAIENICETYYKNLTDR